jgi:uncharacterized protein (TIGR02118 family)
MKTKTALLILLFGISFGCLQAQTKDAPQVKKGMIKVTVLYPNGEGKTFDMDYYTKKHMPLMAKFFDLKIYSIDKGIAGGTPDAPVPFLAIGYLYFDKLSDYEKALALHVKEIRADFPNYTNTTPLIQISEVIE